MAMLIGDKISRYILTSRKCMRSRLRQSSICRGYRINTRQKGRILWVYLATGPKRIFTDCKGSSLTRMSHDSQNEIGQRTKNGGLKGLIADSGKRSIGKLRTSEHLDGTIAMVEAYTSRNMRTLY
ncbi:hypothetical protein Ahy_A05g022448 isoform A [Arachis hypogaea]|uniref:Uncharacterized protein n=1 Tax=Arachis hypogaea TaxID=3818 RepID=A0A445D0S6_ARAHY|nr:hypothetical protein Ahy_A05g022448 isoform A [Arachis hypogaea]